MSELEKDFEPFRGGTWPDFELLKGGYGRLRVLQGGEGIARLRVLQGGPRRICRSLEHLVSPGLTEGTDPGGAPEPVPSGVVFI
mgnify:CR=1 FL=1